MPHQPGEPGVLYLVVCAAPPARHIHQLVELLHHDGWAVRVIATPQAATWIDRETLARLTGQPVRSQPRSPDEPTSLPPAAAVAVVPATFNTINKWAAGISDTFALGILNETLGLRLPIIVSPYAKAPLAAHPAFPRNLQLLQDHGVHLTATDALRPDIIGAHFRWPVVVELLRQAVRT